MRLVRLFSNTLRCSRKIHSDLTVSNVVVEDFLKPLETAEAEKGRKKKSNV